MTKITQSNGDPKWFSLINDSRVDSPQRIVQVIVLKSQGNIPSDHVLVRDFNSPNDVILSDSAEVDLAEGNVFYSIPACDAKPREKCGSKPKLAFSVDDRVETTINPIQSGKSLRNWFRILSDRQLLRDFESPNDEIIKEDSEIKFAAGPVFITRLRTKVAIDFATPKGMYSASFPVSATLDFVIKFIIEELELQHDDQFDLVQNGQVLGPKNKTLRDLGFGCTADVDLVATGSGV